uniref:Uncharacterized protein n=1 Tax=Chromera velia CCMP2878 TaxID=1169474 RepID=A0A0G4GXV1_9ALVE|eukprot:Cvel_23835.t1-p1 / transcript=Cvel_23835.t1 / gene=Cvel_23835 / organism=Chromera_velia_CCMP2878 / gene_product=hypothetical protein / transcript_product=hypothetical protein / location=Cvel_scaffold2506:9507-10368(+) / protein_length=177 / sequence_SO=supercontig / SO=protein_coding / is_pseudo=false
MAHEITPCGQALDTKGGVSLKVALLKGKGKPTLSIAKTKHLFDWVARAARARLPSGVAAGVAEVCGGVAVGRVAADVLVRLPSGVAAGVAEVCGGVAVGRVAADVLVRLPSGVAAGVAEVCGGVAVGRVAAAVLARLPSGVAAGVAELGLQLGLQRSVWGWRGCSWGLQGWRVSAQT